MNFFIYINSTGDITDAGDDPAAWLNSWIQAHVNDNAC